MDGKMEGEGRRAETAAFYGRDKQSIFVPWKVQLSVSVVLG